MKIKYVYLTIAVFFNCLVIAQDERQQPPPEGNDSTRNTRSVTMAEIIPESPKVASMTKFGTYPVSLYTGLVDITVPVYKISVNNIEVPIEFKYHASGIKYDDISLEVGLGWSLIAGGTVDFASRGATEYPVFKKSVSSIDNTGNCNNSDITSLMEVANGNMAVPGGTNGISRGEPDIYTYSFLNYSGQFFIPLADSGPWYGLSGAVFIPTQPLKFENPANLLIISDASGTSYTFEEKEYIENDKRKAYYLTKIISADKVDTVYFNYTYYSPGPPNGINRIYINQTITIIEKYIIFSLLPGYNTSETSEYGAYGFMPYYPPRLNSITFRGGRIDFEYYNNLAISRDLRTIKVYNNISSTPLQTISLVKSQFAGSRGDRLDQVTFKNQQNESYSYQFEYNGDAGIDPGGIDYWGYYNGQGVVNNNFLPDFTVSRIGYLSGFQIGKMNRSANEFFMQKGILNKIIYPTKGYTEFKYEAHRADSMIYGGLRINEIYNYNHDGTLAEKKWYKYGESESGKGIAAVYPKAEDFVVKSRTLEQYSNLGVSPTLGYVFDFRTYLSFPKQSYFTSGSSVVYTNVTEYTGNGTTDTGKTIYAYEYFPKEEHSYSSQTIGVMRQGGTFDIPARSYEWKNGQLKSKTTYKKENGVYTQIYSLSNTYDDINTKEYINLRVIPYISITHYNSDLEPQAPIPPDILTCYDDPRYSTYKTYIEQAPVDYFNYYITTGLRVLTGSTETIDGVTKGVGYTYNSYGLPATVTTTLIPGKVYTTNYKYPTEKGGTIVYDTMITRNMLSSIIETRETVNTALTAFHRTEYGMNHPNNANLIAPVSEDYQSGNQSAPETRITYNRYDPKGNPVHLVKDSADNVVYLWGYNNRYPIAEIKGATFSDVTNKVSEASLNTIAAKDEPSPGDWITINGLRNSLTDALVTTYTYIPLLGMQKMTDPRGVVTEYNYDSFGRLITVTEGNKVIEQYDYNYKY